MVRSSIDSLSFQLRINLNRNSWIIASNVAPTTLSHIALTVRSSIVNEPKTDTSVQMSNYRVTFRLTEHNPQTIHSVSTSDNVTKSFQHKFPCIKCAESEFRAVKWKLTTKRRCIDWKRLHRKRVVLWWKRKMREHSKCRSHRYWDWIVWRHRSAKNAKMRNVWFRSKTVNTTMWRRHHHRIVQFERPMCPVCTPWVDSIEKCAPKHQRTVVVCRKRHAIVWPNEVKRTNAECMCRRRTKNEVATTTTMVVAIHIVEIERGIETITGTVIDVVEIEMADTGTETVADGQIGVAVPIPNAVCIRHDSKTSHELRLQPKHLPRHPGTTMTTKVRPRNRSGTFRLRKVAAIQNGRNGRLEAAVAAFIVWRINRILKTIRLDQHQLTNTMHGQMIGSVPVPHHKPVRHSIRR